MPQFFIPLEQINHHNTLPSLQTIIDPNFLLSMISYRFHYTQSVRATLTDHNSPHPNQQHLKFTRKQCSLSLSLYPPLSSNDGKGEGRRSRKIWREGREKRIERGMVGRTISRVETGLIKGRNRHKSRNGEETKNRSKLDSVRVSKRVEIKTRLSFAFSSCWNSARDAFEKGQLFSLSLSLSLSSNFHWGQYHVSSISFYTFLVRRMCVCVDGYICMSRNRVKVISFF